MGAEAKGTGRMSGGGTYAGRRIVVTGGRDFSDAALVSEAFDALGISYGDVIIEGEAAGTDTLCRLEAERRGISVERFPAEWARYGRMAGPIRNRRMLESDADMLLAFPGGRGTRNCVATAKDMGIPVIRAVEVIGNPRELGA